MEILLVRYYIRNTRGSGPTEILADHYINVVWDDVAMTLIVHEFSDSSDTTPTVRTVGADLGDVSTRGRTRPPADVDIVTPAGGIIPYSFCSGTTLESFKWKSSFPYAEKISTPNSFQCASAVCDLTFTSSNFENASDAITADGSITVEATSSNGIIKYGLTDFNYATEGQLSGLFLGLLPGTYNVIAKDEINCIAQVTVVVGIPNFYNVKYRLEYDDVKSGKSRVDILERGYEGEISEVCGGADPLVISTPNDIDKFSPVIPSKAVVQLLSESNFYFQDLFTQDDRKYQVKYYKYGLDTVPGFTPAELDDIGDWDEDASGLSWVGLTFSATGSSKISNKKFTIYAFEEGQTYSFDYNFSVTGTGIGCQIRIQITNSSGSSLGASKTVDVSGGGSYSGNYTFVAPAGADRITLVVRHILSFEEMTYTVNAFDNVTESTSDTVVGFYLKWFGYVIPENYSEPYLAPPYVVNVTATDGLADLKSFEFTDHSGNILRDDIVTIDAIKHILNKTDLGVNIISAINKYEEDMDDGDADDPLTQCKFEASIFLTNNIPNDCLFVLSEILKPFGAKIRQRLGKWFIYITEQVVSEMEYREFNSNGNYVANGTINDVVDIDVPMLSNRAAFRDRTQFLEIIPAYGKFYLQHILNKNASLVKSYSFEDYDLYTAPSGLVLLKNWNVNILNEPGAEYGIKETKAFDGSYNFFLKAGTVTSANTTNETILNSIGGGIEFESIDAFEFSFSYSAILSSRATASKHPLWLRLRWVLQIGSYFYSESLGDWTTDADYQYNSLYISGFNQPLQFKIVAEMPPVTDLSVEDFNIEFVFESSSRVDFLNADINTNLQAIPTVDLPIGAKVKGHGFGGLSTGRFVYYELVDNDDSITGEVEPDDYDEDDNNKVWVKMQSIAQRNEHYVRYVYLDNVVLKHFPKGLEPPESITIESVNNAQLKINKEETFLLNDIDIDNINNSERTYKNFFKLLDGTPTQIWERSYRPGEGKLLDLLSNEYKSQYRRGSNKITGNFTVDIDLLPSSCLNEVNDNGKKYMFLGYEFHDLQCSVSFDVAEIMDVITDDESPDIDAGFTTGFSLGFRS